MHKVLVIGSVTSTAVTLQKLVSHKFKVLGVLGYKPRNGVKNVSGWYDLGVLADELGIPFQSFEKINESVHLDWAQRMKPDIIFAIGFSQLLDEAWLQLPKLGCVGFHPTLLPRGRGRAPLAWVVLRERVGAASFFLMGAGADDGPLFVQEKFELESTDDANSVRIKLLSAMETALDHWLPELKNGVWNPIPQNEWQATYYGKRTPSDGLLRWQDATAEELDLLVKASTVPHPGAFTYAKYEKLTVWKSKIEGELQIVGVPGRILLINDQGHLLVQCQKGLLWLTDYEVPSGRKLLVGERLGYNVEFEIYRIWKKIHEIENTSSSSTS